MDNEFDIAMKVAQEATTKDPSLQFYVECPDGGYLLVNSNGCTGPYRNLTGNETGTTYTLEIKRVFDSRKT